MTRREAAQILDVPQTAPAKDIRTRHRKLMMANHPDGGGSPFLATKINEAKDTLMGKK
jgi:DnaJ family protein C protein 19